MSAFGPREPADADPFAQMLRENLDAAGRLAVRLCGNLHAAEDVLGEALLRAVRGRASYRGDAAFAAWLYAIVVNTFRDSLRAREVRRPTVRLAGDEAEVPAGTLDRLEAQEVGERVAARVSALPPRQREAMVLTVYEGLSTEDAAAAMQTTATNVRVLVHQARTRLKQELADLVETRNAPGD